MENIEQLDSLYALRSFTYYQEFHSFPKPSLSEMVTEFYLVSFLSSIEMNLLSFFINIV